MKFTIDAEIHIKRFQERNDFYERERRQSTD